MKIGITELLKSGKREFSDSELLRCLEDALKIYPLGEVYRKAVVLEPYPSKINGSKPAEGADFSNWIQDVLGITHDIIVDHGKDIRKKYGIDTLVLTLGKDPRLNEYGYAWQDDYNGRGEVFLGNPAYPANIAHELGHLWSLGHHYKGGQSEKCIMHVPGDLLMPGKVTEFSVINQQAIIDAYKRYNNLVGRISRLPEYITNKFAKLTNK